MIIAIAACGSPPRPEPVDKPAPACTAVADHVLDLVTPKNPKDDKARKLRDIFALRCEQDAWSADVRTCVLSTTSLKDPKGCKSQLAIPQREALERDLAEAEKAAREAALSSCDRYKQRIEQLMACDRLPQSSRDALKQGFDAMNSAWSQVGDLSEEARKAMDEGCKMGTEALEQAVKDLCGW